MSKASRRSIFIASEMGLKMAKLESVSGNNGSPRSFRCSFSAFCDHSDSCGKRWHTLVSTRARHRTTHPLHDPHLLLLLLLGQLPLPP